MPTIGDALQLVLARILETKVAAAAEQRHRLGHQHIAGANTVHLQILPGLLRIVLGPTVFEEREAEGAALEPGEAVRYARDQIQLARSGSGALS